MTVVCTDESTTTMTVTIATTSVRLVAPLSQHDMVLQPTPTPRDTMKNIILPLWYSSTSFPDASLGLCQVCHGSFSGGFFFFNIEPPTSFFMLVFFTVFAFMVFAVCFQVSMWPPFSQVGLIHWVYTIATLQCIPMAGIYAYWSWFMPMPGMHWVAVLCCCK